MGKTIQVYELANAITEILSEYNEAVTDETKKVVDEISQEVKQEILNHVTFNDNHVYTKAMDVKTSFEDKRNKRNTWYVKSPHYRLTHLLEFRHYTRNGRTKTREFPHIRYGEEYLQNNFERKMKEGIEKCKI